MTLTFYNNYLNHHTVHIADELYRTLGNGFHFVATLPFNKNEMKGGDDYSSRPYLLLASNNNVSYEKAMSLARESDVCVFGACSQKYAIARAKQKDCGLSFEMGERWLKRGIINIFSPNLIRWWLNYIRYFHKKPFYKLCSSSFAAKDDKMLGAYRGRHYKWGYFTAVPKDIEVNAANTSNTGTHIMWCSRLLNWKHPELPVKMAALLKQKGYKFQLDMYGTGPEEERTKQLIQQLGVEDVVKMHGAQPNENILQAMREHEIFLFTSDRFEGWGAVANESMANGCVLVASNAIGCTPYLVKDGVNGFAFESENVKSLTSKVEWLLNHPEERYKMQCEAHRTMTEFWSPRKAATALLTLINCLQDKKETTINDGPCSKA